MKLTVRLVFGIAGYCVVLCINFIFLRDYVDYEGLKLSLIKIESPNLYADQPYLAPLIDLRNVNRSDPQDKCWINSLLESQRAVILDDDLRWKVGYGNRVYSFLNAIVMAVVSNSTLLFRWRHLDQYIQIKNLPNVVLNSPNYDLKQIWEKAGKPQHCLIDYETPNAWQARKNIDSFHLNITKSNKPCDKHKITIASAMFFELASNPVYFEAFRANGLVRESTLNQARSVMANKTNYSDTINKLFSVGFELAHNILYNSWIPSFQSEVDEFFKQNFRGYFVIGIQIRFFYLHHNQDTYELLKCALMAEMSYRSRFGDAAKPVKWFVTTDSTFRLRRMKQHFRALGKIITTEGSIANVVEDESGWKRTVMDVELLSRCDELIMTSGSTYGMIAAIKMGRLPLFFSGKQRSKQCERMSFDNLGIRKLTITAI